MTHPHIGFLHVGDTISTKSKGGKQISVTIKNIAIDPTWLGDGILIKIDHTVDGVTKETFLNLVNFQQWFQEATWVKEEKS